MPSPLYLDEYRLGGAVLLGIFLGLYTEAYAMWRAVARPRRWRSQAADGFFWLGMLLILLPALFLLNGLSLRFYVWLGLGLGYACYLLLGAPLWRRLLPPMLGLGVRLLRWVGRPGRALRRWILVRLARTSRAGDSPSG